MQVCGCSSGDGNGGTTSRESLADRVVFLVRRLRTRGFGLADSSLQPFSTGTCAASGSCQKNLMVTLSYICTGVATFHARLLHIAQLLRHLRVLPAHVFSVLTTVLLPNTVSRRRLMMRLQPTNGCSHKDCLRARFR